MLISSSALMQRTVEYLLTKYFSGRSVTQALSWRVVKAVYEKADRGFRNTQNGCVPW
jgi:hypothetical protein